MLKKLGAAVATGTLLVAGVGSLTGAAFAQEKGEYRNATRTKGPDMAIIQEAVDTLAGGAECNVVFTVGLDGKPKDVEPNCSDERYNPYIVKSVEAMEYLPEIFDGELFETEGVKQPFKFGVVSAADGSAGTPPKVKKNIRGGDISRAINKVDKSGQCDIEFTVGVDGKPKDIATNCTPKAYDRHILPLVEKMEYEPGMKNGEAVEWPNMKAPLNLSAD